jgi:DNA-binding CsgD family transcriptional regulator
VIFDGRSIHLDGRVEDTFETRTMERSNGTWQILYASFVLRGHQQVDANRLAVDADGRVPCAPNAALNLLVGHDCLQISAGRLRATTPAWDKTLQAAIQSAAAQHGYFQHYRYTTEHGRNFRLPVVLGEKDEGGVAVCVLFVRDGVTFVETQNDGDLDARLTIAKAIFGLSDGQMQLAKRIVNGDGLIAAAAALGITINTAKTHLSRIYVKTGVNAQTALVRSLLSVG